MSKHFRNSTQYSSLNTLEAVLYRFGKEKLLRTLENSLEDVKKNKINAEDHNQLVKTEDKKLLKMSLKFHPDHAGTASYVDADEAHELQSALNATRTVLKILTQIFLEKISVDYRYEYFSKLDISLLASKDEIQKRIEAVFNKICKLSETKRMNIVGEIRNFLVECRKTVKSYLKNDRSEFEKNRDHALHHLKKNIEGHKKLVEECRALVEECIEENDENMGSVIESVMTKTLNELRILSALESVAKCSFRGKFKIFQFDKSMDKYYISPFIFYANVLSMCNLLLLSNSCSCIPFLHGSLSCGPVRNLFSKAYNLAFDIYHEKHCSFIDKITDLNAYIWETNILKEELNIMLKAIFKVLEEEFKLDDYKEGKSNNTELYESVKKVRQDLEEEGKKCSEVLNRIEMDRERNRNNLKKISEIDIECSINCDENVSKEFATPGINFRLDATYHFTNIGNLSQRSKSDWH